jgi:biofilm protein TabA
MILDVIGNLPCYQVLNKGFAKAIEFLSRPDIKELPAGRYEIDEERIYAMVSKGYGRKKEDALLEVHEKYIDIQLLLEGSEKMGWKSRSSCIQQSGEYDQTSDFQFFADEPDVWFSIASGTFVIFFREDAHMPLISSGQVHKVVVKVIAGAT